MSRLNVKRLSPLSRSTLGYMRSHLPALRREAVIRMLLTVTAGVLEGHAQAYWVEDVSYSFEDLAAR